MTRSRLEPPPTAAESAQRGRDARSVAPRSSHGDWRADRDTIDPVLIGVQAVSPFAFLCGAAAVMAADLAGTPTSGITVQLCGDAHLGNFGAFAGPGRRMLFEIGDFDETLPGPWEWDVKRLAASTEVAARERSFSAADRADAVRAAVLGYAAAMRRLAGMRTMDVWCSRTEVDAGLREWVRGLPRVTDRVDEAADDVTTTFVGDALRTYRTSLTADRRRLLASYRVADVACGVDGVAWIVRLLGRDGDDPLVLRLKEAGRSVLEAHLGAYVSDNGARRVVDGQRLMQSADDVLLGWATTDGRDLYVRQLWDARLSVPIEVLPPPELATYAATCGEALARAHARSGDRFAIAAYLGRGERFADALVRFAGSYADQNEHDHAAFAAAVTDPGR
jgi:hypothetical protein